MYVLAIDPQRLGHLDVLLPIILQLKKDNPNIFFEVVYLDARQFEILNKNRFLSEMLESVGKAVLLKSLGKKGSILKKITLTLQLIRYMLKVVTTKRVVYLQWKSIDFLLAKIFGGLASIRGKTLTYQPMNNHYIEEMRRYFDECGHPRTERAKFLLARQFKQKVNTGDSALVNSIDSLNYFAIMGYSRFKIIGYTHLYPEYIKYSKANCYTHLAAEIPLKNLETRSFVGIFVNKFWGKWGGQNDAWFINKFCEIIDCLRETESEPIVLVRGHPTLKTDVIERAIKESGYGNIFITYLHPTLVGMVSGAVIGITESTAYHYVVGAGTPYIDYGGMRPENYEIFPEGSLNASYGTIVAENKKELIEKLLDKELLSASVANYIPLLKHKMNLSVFE